MGSVKSFEKTNRRRRPPGKIDAPLDKKLQAVKWGKFRLGDLFEIQSTSSFNSDCLVPGTEYDYVTRTSFNQGILRTTGFVNEENINSAGTWSLGLLQMDFFYRNKPWYAGQFVRRIVPKIYIPKNSVLFFQALLNRQKPILLQVLVRYIDETFRNIIVELPTTSSGEIDFDFMESFIRELEDERVRELKSYLVVTGLQDYTLTDEEQNALNTFDSLEWNEFNVTDIFAVKNTHNILSSEIVEDSGENPYLCASAENNGVSSFISFNTDFLEDGNCIFIGGKTFVVSYQKDDFFSNDSHNLALYLRDVDVTKANQLYLASCIIKSLSHKYSWGNSISNAKIKNDKIMLPEKDGNPDFKAMETFISAIQKLVIKDVVLYTEEKLMTAK